MFHRMDINVSTIFTYFHLLHSYVHLFLFIVENEYKGYNNHDVIKWDLMSFQCLWYV